MELPAQFDFHFGRLLALAAQGGHAAQIDVRPQVEGRAVRTRFAGATDAEVQDVADRMEEWFVGGACDGFVLAGTHVPGSYEDFVRLVVPELQRRGLFRTEYEGPTLRENLGIPLPV